MKNYFDRFKHFNVDDWITNVFLFVAFVIGLYFCIGTSISLARGETLFNAGQARDIWVFTLLWILTILVLATFIYSFFFKKIKRDKIIKKEIANGKTFVIEEENKDKDENK